MPAAMQQWCCPPLAGSRKVILDGHRRRHAQLGCRLAHLAHACRSRAAGGWEGWHRRQRGQQPSPETRSSRCHASAAAAATATAAAAAAHQRGSRLTGPSAAPANAAGVRSESMALSGIYSCSATGQPMQRMHGWQRQDSPASIPPAHLSLLDQLPHRRHLQAGGGRSGASADFSAARCKQLGGLAAAASCVPRRSAPWQRSTSTTTPTAPQPVATRACSSKGTAS